MGIPGDVRGSGEERALGELERVVILGELGQGVLPRQQDSSWVQEVGCGCGSYGVFDSSGCCKKWVAYIPQTFTPHGSRGWKSEINAPVWPGSSESLLQGLGCQLLSVCSHSKRGKGALWGLFL